MSNCSQKYSIYGWELHFCWYLWKYFFFPRTYQEKYCFVFNLSTPLWYVFLLKYFLFCDIPFTNIIHMILNALLWLVHWHVQEISVIVVRRRTLMIILVGKQGTKVYSDNIQQQAYCFHRVSTVLFHNVSKEQFSLFCWLCNIRFDKPSWNHY